jgi:hypothetical protein
MREPSGAPPPAGVLFPELLEKAEAAPPPQRRGSRLLKLLGRVTLWSLIAAGAFRGLMPAPQGLAPAAPPGPEEDGRAAAVAAAFLREYLTVGDDQTARAERLGRFTAAGVDLRRSVSMPGGVAQYADQVVPAGSRPVAGGVEVTVLAHVLQVRSGAYRDGGTLAFVVPLAIRREGIAVAGGPRPTSLPFAPELSLPRPQPAPTGLSQAELSQAGRVARQAVLAVIRPDKATLARLGGGLAPSTRPLPAGWRALSVGTAEVAGPSGALAALVPVLVRPPTGGAAYLVPVSVQLEVGPRGLTVRRVELGGSP